MPDKLPEGVEIHVSLRSLPADYQMPVMGMSTDHYSIGLILSGDRRIITPKETYDAHRGDVSMMAPFLYHRTASLSDAPYVSYLVKYTASAVEPLLARTGASFLEEMNERKIHHFGLESQARLQSLLADMAAVYGAGRPYAELLLQGQLHRLLTIIYEEHTGDGAERFPSPLSPVIVDLLAQMEARYGEDLRLSAMSREAGYSDAHLSRLFSSQLHCSFSEYLSRIRLRHVCLLLADTNMSVSDIALACGYCNGDYLSTRFRAGMGVSPTVFRRQARKNIVTAHPNKP